MLDYKTFCQTITSERFVYLRLNLSSLLSSFTILLIKRLEIASNPTPLLLEAWDIIYFMTCHSLSFSMLREHLVISKLSRQPIYPASCFLWISLINNFLAHWPSATVPSSTSRYFSTSRNLVGCLYFSFSLRYSHVT